MAEKRTQACWPGYEPVPGKPQHSQGSCKPKADSKSTGEEKEFRAKRKKQLVAWQKDPPGSKKSAAQHLHAPGTTPKRKAAAKTATTKRAAKAAKKRPVRKAA